MITLEQLSNSVETHLITAIIDTALCVGAGGSSGSLADKPIVRNAEGNLLIPASQFKGRLRHECEKIANGLLWPICESPQPQTMCPQRAGLEKNFEREEYKFNDKEDTAYHCLICQIFGNPVLQSRLRCDDLVCTEHPNNLPEVLRSGVTINRRRRTAEEKKLYFLETSPVNAQLRFEGDIHILPDWTSDRPDYAKALIWAGLRRIYALGGGKSVGLGWLHWELPEITIDEDVWQFLGKGGLQ
ncbi:CRISPR-associated protein Csm3 [Aphanothece hegewaldii CCALA 016]|uniref:CRISPR-associated protein Csm3 n=1 Tax=Aphanothece hegewaldii CCALA 016 TaxID=2107694 RepID=A0A2T1LYB1_9CHRO|nr:RAMP superfamily CRISPR-associated protein [Aphanothece hegewaldii]PSF37381.1 CRISPR-associated protein Csm3 [Aphanothece hegewaldii CCALA 016]